MKKKTYEWLIKFTKIANRAMKKAQDENSSKGLPNVYFKNGKIVYEMPDGSITTKNPMVK